MWSMSSKVDVFKQDIQIIEMFVPLKLRVSHRTKCLLTLSISSNVAKVIMSVPNIKNSQQLVNKCPGKLNLAKAFTMY